MKLIRGFCFSTVLIALAASAAAMPINVAQGKAVSITGDVGVITAGSIWPGSAVHPPASLSSLVDGLYVPEGTEWQTGTVWWDEGHPGSFNNVIEIDLNGSFLVSYLSIQADNNDKYGIFVRDGLGVWSGFATVRVFGSSGMRERAGGFSPFLATAFRIDAFGGDGLYSLSEFRAMGEPVPEPGSIFLLGTGALGLIARRRRKQQHS